MNFFSKLFKAVRRWFSERAMSDIERAAALVGPAIQIVAVVAALTPTRSDDELIELFRHYAVPGVDAWLALPPADRGRALMTVAARELKRLTPDVGDRIIDLAVQLAVVGK